MHYHSPDVSRLRLPLLAAIAVPTSLNVFAACSDWTVRQPPVDASLADTASGEKGPEDGGVSDDVVVADAAPETPPSVCESLEDAIAKALLEATRCNVGSPCPDSIIDACDCAKFVARGDSGAAAKFSAAVVAFQESGCPRPASCPAFCSPTASSQCLFVDAGGFCFN